MLIKNMEMLSGQQDDENRILLILSKILQ